MHDNLFDFKKIQDVQSKFYLAKSRLSDLVREKSAILMELSKIGDFLESKDQVNDALNELQLRTQEKTKTIYEDLLTKLIHEVKGYDAENHKLKLRTRIKNNKPWLDVEIENANGHSRDVFLDKGESIENLVSIGLRFITLSRISNRRFLIFDEADRNLNAKQIPNLAKIIFDLSKKMGVQVLYISHHDHENFHGYAKIIELSRIIDKNSSKISTDTISDIEPFSDDAMGIRFVRLHNFKQHENTIVHLSPYVTVITGDVDIGKSSIIHAFEAVNRNGGRDGLIRDNEDFCRVEIGIEEGHVISWSYKSSGSKRTEYLLTDKSNIGVHKYDKGTAEPEWLDQYLAMPKYKDLEVNICFKGSQSFILDERVSGYKRAEVLSLGGEANQVLKMIKLHSQQVEAESKRQTRLNKELLSVKNKLESYNLIFSIEEAVIGISDEQRRLADQDQILRALRRESEELAKLDLIICQLKKIETISIIQPPDIIDKKGIIQAIQSYERLKSLIATIEPIQSVQKIIPVSDQPYDEIKIVCNELIEVNKRIKILERIPNCIAHLSLNDNTKNLLEFGKQISSIKIEIQNSEKEILGLEVEFRKIEESKRKHMLLLHEYCPLCERSN